MIIYQIRNTKNKKCYIGQTIRNVKSRWKAHRCSLKNNQHYNDYLQRAWNKYGKDAFEFSVIDESAETLEQLNALEILYIAMKGEYNLKTGGNNGSLSAESRRKISIAHMGKKASVATRKKIAAASRNRKYGPPTEATKRKISDANKGKRHSDATKKKMSKDRKGKAHSKRTKEILSKIAKANWARKEYRDKISQSLTGRIHSPETRRKISESLKRRNRI